MIEQIYSNKNQKILWEHVLNIHDFNVLYTTFQSNKWYKETNVFNHIKLLVNEVDKELTEKNSDNMFKEILVLSTLFLHIGKGVTTFWNKEKNDWSTKYSSEIGETITRKLLWNEDPLIRETVCYFVRNYQKISHIISSNKGIRELITISCDTIYPKYCTIENLLFIKKCELNFMNYDSKNDLDELDFVKDLSFDLNCLDHPYEFNSSIEKYKYFNDSIDTYPTETTDKPVFEAFLTMGNPKKFNAESIYKNEFRILFDLDKNYDIIDQIIECCENKINFSLDIESIPEDVLEMVFSTIYCYQGKITFVYASEKFINYLSPNLSMSFINAN